MPPAGQVASAAGGYYLSRQPNAAPYVLGAARVVEASCRFRVLVPRTDWRGRQPGRAAFEMDKASGNVTARPVK